MGREIRRVPPNWEHPEKEHFDYRTRTTTSSYAPMHDKTFEKAVADWKDGYAKWEAGEKLSHVDTETGQTCEFWEWDGGPPDREYYRPYRDEEATWYQVYETVSEGTPVTPPFETMAELERYLAENGDFWGDGPWGAQKAAAFCRAGFAFSLAVVDGQVLEAKDQAAYFEARAEAKP